MTSLTQRTKHWIGGGLLLTLILLACPWLIAWKMQSAADAMTRQVASPMATVSLMKDLDLSAPQKQRIEALEKQYKSEIQNFCGQHCSARMKIGELLQAGKMDAKELARWGGEAGGAYVGAEQATLQHLIRICEILTPRQKELLLKKVADHIAATCPAEFMR